MLQCTEERAARRWWLRWPVIIADNDQRSRVVGRSYEAGGNPSSYKTKTMIVVMVVVQCNESVCGIDRICKTLCKIINMWKIKLSKSIILIDHHKQTIEIFDGIPDTVVWKNNEVFLLPSSLRPYSPTWIASQSHPHPKNKNKQEKKKKKRREVFVVWLATWVY